MKLAGKTAIVTGAARGLGLAIAEALLADGAAVVLGDIIDPDEATAARLGQSGGDSLLVRLDVTRQEDWDRALARAEERFGPVSILVNNAGINVVATIEEASVEDFQRTLDVNLLGAFRGIKTVLPSMRRAGGGSIVNIASNSTQLFVPQTTCYSPTKAALANLTKVVAIHCGANDDNIRVNSVHPGPHETAMLLGEASGTDARAVDMPELRAMIAAIPLKRMGKPMEVGRAVAFLASDDASYVNGAELFVDGGLAMH